MKKSGPAFSWDRGRPARHEREARTKPGHRSHRVSISCCEKIYFWRNGGRDARGPSVKALVNSNCKIVDDLSVLNQPARVSRTPWRVKRPIRRSPLRISSQALNAYSSKHSSLAARTTQQFFPERQTCRRDKPGNSFIKLSTCSEVVNSHMPFVPGRFTLFRSDSSSFSSR